MNKFIKIMLLIMLAISCKAKEGEIMQNTKDVSMIQLISNPEMYHGIHIRVIGYTKIGFEINSIYNSELDAKHSILLNAFWLSLTKEEMSKYSKNNEQYSIIEGIFNAHKHGGRRYRLGTIEKISRFDTWD